MSGELPEQVGVNYELTEAKGWKSLPTKRDLHGWPGDAWYDQPRAQEVYREVKLAMYLTDVRSGAFNFIMGSHRRQHPRLVKNDEVKDADIFEVKGPAGTAFLFDTSGIHRQGAPIWKRVGARIINLPLTKVISVSNYGYRCMTAADLLPQDRFEMIYNGVDLSRVW